MKDDLRIALDLIIPILFTIICVYFYAYILLTWPFQTTFNIIQLRYRFSLALISFSLFLGTWIALIEFLHDSIFWGIRNYKEDFGVPCKAFSIFLGIECIIVWSATITISIDGWWFVMGGIFIYILYEASSFINRYHQNKINKSYKMLESSKLSDPSQVSHPSHEEFNKSGINDEKFGDLVKNEVNAGQVLAVKKGESILTRKFALIPQGNKIQKANVINDIREQFIKFRDLENVFCDFFVNLVRENPSIINNQPWEYPNFHLSISREQREQFNSLKENKLIHLDESLPNSAKMRIMKYFYNYYSDPSDPSKNLSRFKSNYRKKDADYSFYERANQNAIQYPFYAVRDWIIRNERLKTITGSLIKLLESTQHRKIYHRKQDKDENVSESHYILKAFLGGSVFHKDFLNIISNKIDRNIFGEFDRPSYDYLKGHIGQLRNLVMKDATLEDTVKASIKNVIGKMNVVPRTLDEYLNPILKEYNNVQDYFLGLFIRVTRKRTTEYARMRLKKGKPLYGTSMEVSLVNSLFDKHKFSSIQQFKKERDLLINKDIIIESEGYKHLDSSEIKSKVLDLFFEFFKSVIENPKLNAIKTIFKPAFPHINLHSFDFAGFIHYMSTKLFYEIKSQFHALFLSLGEANKIKEKLIDALQALQHNIYSMSSPPLFKKMAIPLIQPEYMYEINGVTQTARFGMIKRRGKEYELKVSPKQEDRFKQYHIPHFEQNKKGQYKDNLSNPVLQLKGRKLILCQPFRMKTVSSISPDSVASAKRIEVGVDLGIKHFAVLSIMDKTAPQEPKELKRYFISQKTLHDMRFNDSTGKFERTDNKAQPTNIKLKLISLRKQHKIIQKKRSDYENRHPGDYEKKIKWYHLSKTESSIWNKIHQINADIVSRLSGLIVRIAAFNRASCIRFEDLRWSRHQPKREKGKFIAFWQVHWFHSQVQQKTAQNASRKGIQVVLVNPYMSSHECAHCKQRGFRHPDNMKLFTCPHCNMTVDSDLNAARNIVKRDTVKILSVSFSSEYLCSVDGLQ